MRLWHQRLWEKLPLKQVLGQHRECCALRGKGWEKRHSTVQYALDSEIEKLIAYHKVFMIKTAEIHKIYYAREWIDPYYRGKLIGKDNSIIDKDVMLYMHKALSYDELIYKEHTDEYYQECIENLKNKGIFI